MFRRRACSFGVVVDFLVDDLYFMVMENGVWAVNCEGECLMFGQHGACLVD